MKHRNKALALTMLLYGLFIPSDHTAQAQTSLIDSLFVVAPMSELPLI